MRQKLVCRQKALIEDEERIRKQQVKQVLTTTFFRY